MNDQSRPSGTAPESAWRPSTSVPIGSDDHRVRRLGPPCGDELNGPHTCGVGLPVETTGNCPGYCSSKSIEWQIWAGRNDGCPCRMVVH